METNSFFNLFDYNYLMHDAIDCGLVYECCKITRDVTTSSGHSLKKGDDYEAIWFLFKEQLFQFITNWVPSEPTNSNCGLYIQGPGSIVIPQAELAPYLMWFEEDLPLAIGSLTNDHKCLACGNEKCNKTEKSCWKCGHSI